MKIFLLLLLLGVAFSSCKESGCSFVCYSIEQHRISENSVAPYQFVSEKKFFHLDKVDFNMNNNNDGMNICTIDSCYLLRK